MLWKIYFLYLAVSFLGYLKRGLTLSILPVEVFTIILSGIAMAGLFGFSWKKKIFTRIFWKVFLFIYLSWNLYYQYSLPLSEEAGLAGLPKALAAIISWIPFVPLFIALYLYAFRRADYRSGYKLNI